MQALTLNPAQAVFNKDLTPKTLHPLAAYDATEMQPSNQRWSSVWKVAAIVTAVAFIAIAAFATAYTSLYLAEHLALVTVGVFVMLLPAGNVFKNLWEKSDAYAQTAAHDGKLVENMKKKVSLPEGFTPIAQGKALENLKARYQYVKDMEKELFKESEKPLTEVRLDGITIPVNERDYTVEKVDFSNPQQAAIFSAFQKNLGYALGCSEQAAICRLKAAHLLKLIQDPYELKAMDKFFQFVPLNLADRLLARFGTDKNAFVLAKTKDGEMYTDSEILETDEIDLAEQLFELEVDKDLSDTNTG